MHIYVVPAYLLEGKQLPYFLFAPLTGSVVVKQSVYGSDIHEGREPIYMNLLSWRTICFQKMSTLKGKNFLLVFSLRV